MAESVPSGLIDAVQIARDAVVRKAPNGLRYAAFGDNNLSDSDLERMVQAVPSALSEALATRIYFFVPLAMSEPRPRHERSHEPAPGSGSEASHERGQKHGQPTLISPLYTPQLSEEAICHRNVALDGPLSGSEGVFISTRLLSDRFALAFELFINVGHAFVDTAGVPESFADLVWNQALADVRGETSQDAWEDRNTAIKNAPANAPASGSAPEFIDGKPRCDEKARTGYTQSAFSDAIAIYLLSLAVDFDYSELREREYPLLAPQALAERLRTVHKLFPPNPTYDFAIRYRRRA